MIKTVKVKKSFRLDELIKHIFDNGIRNQLFKDTLGDWVIEAAVNGTLGINGPRGARMSEDRRFEIEVEEKITEDTVFAELVTVGIHGTISQHENMSLSMLHDKGLKEQGRQVFALINGKLELIYERNEESINA